MILQTIFSNFVITEDLELDNKKLKSFCYDTHSPHGNYVDVGSPQLKNFIDIVNDRFSKIHTMLQFSDSTCQRINTCWINIKLEKSISMPHIHPHGFLTAVYYVSASENSGDLFLMNPNPHHAHMIPASSTRNIVKHHNEFNSGQHVIKPKSGKLVIFPSGLMHYVRSGDGSERISIALDSSIIDKDKNVKY
jgi:uncharacterized protein (TIGR02466 family)